MTKEELQLMKDTIIAQDMMFGNKTSILFNKLTLMLIDRELERIEHDEFLEAITHPDVKDNISKQLHELAKEFRKPNYNCTHRYTDSGGKCVRCGENIL